jgi:hypothetical protein
VGSFPSHQRLQDRSVDVWFVGALWTWQTLIHVPPIYIVLRKRGLLPRILQAPSIRAREEILPYQGYPSLIYRRSHSIII